MFQIAFNKTWIKHMFNDGKMLNYKNILHVLLYELFLCCYSLHNYHTDSIFFIKVIAIIIEMLENRKKRSLIVNTYFPLAFGGVIQ